MKVIRGLRNISPVCRGAWLTIGNFDGLHLGHRAIIDTLKMHAAKNHSPTMVINFHPSPDSYFHPEQPKAKLMRLREKMQLLATWGVNYLLLLPFNAKLAALSASQFLEDILIKQLGIRGIVVGDDFHFGFKRQGNVELLQAYATSGAYQCIPLAEQQDVFMHRHCEEAKGRRGNPGCLDATTHSIGQEVHLLSKSSHSQFFPQRISSTRIRQALSDSDFALAEALLGRPFRIEGRVRPGQMRGRLLGFPTANIPLGRLVSPLLGVFAGWVDMHETYLPAVANIGWRPTVGGTKEPLLEIHLLDYQGDLYGKRLSFIPISKLRYEQKFEGLEALQTQLHADVAAAKSILLNKVTAAL